ncbi:hypothetical protein [Curtobacterium sp. MCLR17_055]|uniref:hypothetical protein n=1 Tax=Curtobacterium sp. MCLR17_055 TaxID=2175633 RepID=UPI000DA7CF21|nr:hypothetical protein [Curtobacterium sp. MCLR17_055]PZE33596.1 hypothetical protein DEJ09_00325 [Curtobacterium sp. MCLR17_055]
MLSDFRVCHYTSADGLLSILRSGTLWATSATFMNDSEEMQTGATAFAGLLESRREDLTEDEIEHIEASGLVTGTGAFGNFLLSAATDPDKLTLWRNYGVSEVAYSVELDPATRLVPLAQVSGDAHPSPPAGYFDREYQTDPETGDRLSEDPHPDTLACMGGGWRKVTYVTGPEDPTIADHFERDLEQYRARQGQPGFWIPRYMLTNSALDFIKDAGFADESEVRSVHWVNPWWKFVRYRAGRFGVTPYIELTTMDESEDFATSAGKLPIKSVTVGPNAPTGAKQAARALLQSYGYDAPVQRSKTPYR